MTTWKFQRFGHYGGVIVAGLILIGLIFTPLPALDCLICAGLVYVFIGAPLGVYACYLTGLPKTWLESAIFPIVAIAVIAYQGLPLDNFELVPQDIEAVLGVLMGSFTLAIFSTAMVEIIKKRLGGVPQKP